MINTIKHTHTAVTTLYNYKIMIITLLQKSFLRFKKTFSI